MNPKEHILTKVNSRIATAMAHDKCLLVKHLFKNLLLTF